MPPVSPMTRECELCRQVNTIKCANLWQIVKDGGPSSAPGRSKSRDSAAAASAARRWLMLFSSHNAQRQIYAPADGRNCHMPIEKPKIMAFHILRKNIKKGSNIDADELCARRPLPPNCDEIWRGTGRPRWGGPLGWWPLPLSDTVTPRREEVNSENRRMCTANWT